MGSVNSDQDHASRLSGSGSTPSSMDGLPQ